MNNRNCLNDVELSKVQGGTDWKSFGNELINSLSSYTGTITPELKELVEACKDKDWSKVSVLVVPLIATDPLIRDLYYKYQ